MVEETGLTEPLAGQEDYGPLALQERLGGAGRWERFTYSGPPGSRVYFVYTPAGYTLDKRVPMVVMLHGCTQTPAAGTEWHPLADRQMFVAVYPEQSSDDHQLSCWNWFLPVHQVRGSGEAGVIAGISQQVLTSDMRWNIDPGRVYVAGMSAGGDPGRDISRLVRRHRSPLRSGVPGLDRRIRCAARDEEPRP